jgi:hypothetical protein
VAAPHRAAPLGAALRARRCRTVRRLPDFKEIIMPIRMICQCGRTLIVKDELRGKRIKCPNCHAPLVVGASGAAMRNHQNANGGGKKKGGKKVLFAVLGIGFLMSGCCCTGIAGVAVWRFWPTGASSELEKKIVGKWVSGIEAPKSGAKPDDLVKQAFSAGMIEFKADGTVLDASPMTPILQGKWRTLSADGDAITVELTDSRNTNKLDIKFVSDDSVKITPADSRKEFTFKRVKI